MRVSSTQIPPLLETYTSVPSTKMAKTMLPPIPLLRWVKRVEPANGEPRHTTAQGADPGIPRNRIMSNSRYDRSRHAIVHGPGLPGCAIMDDKPVVRTDPHLVLKEADRSDAARKRAVLRSLRRPATANVGELQRRVVGASRRRLTRHDEDGHKSNKPRATAPLGATNGTGVCYTSFHDYSAFK